MDFVSHDIYSVSFLKVLFIYLSTYLSIYIFIFREEGRETVMCVKNIDLFSHTPPTGDLAHNSGVCPDRESNQ